MAVACAAALATVPPHFGGAARASEADPPGRAFAALVERWQNVRDYSLTIDAHEVDGARIDDRTLRYEFRKPDRARLEVLSGNGAGSVVIWHGGNDAVAYRRSLPWLRGHFDARSKRVTSPRGNGVLTPNLGALLTCWSEHRDALSEHALDDGDDAGSDRIELRYDGFSCPTDAARDKDVTRDVLIVSRSTHLVMRRERYEGSTLVERWTLRDLQLDAGINDSRF